MMNVPELNKKLKENVVPINGLRKFQQNTVRHAVCALAANGSRKFLVADEVGLGKTKVARGVIQNFLAAQAGEPDSGALTVLYLCANQQLAWQNLKSFHHFDMYLKPDEENINSDIRLSLLSWKKRNERTENRIKLHVYALTPGTSFEVSSGAGNMEERAVITALLDEKSQDASFQAVMEKYSPVKQGNTQDSNWKKTLKAVESETDRLNQLRDDLLIQLKNEELSNLFSFYNVKNDDLLTGIRECFREYGNVDEKTHSSWRKDPSYPGSPLSFMRQVMSKLGIKAVQPDLIIMDEFQRYDRLLFEREKDSEMDLFAILVKEYEKQTCQPYFLLLSATPYATFSGGNELPDQNEKAHSGFIRLLHWLAGDNSVNFEQLRTSYFDALKKDELRLPEAKAEFEQAILNYMCRTERKNLKESEAGKDLFNSDFPESLWQDEKGIEQAAEEISSFQNAYQKFQENSMSQKLNCGKWNQLLGMMKYASKPLSFMKYYKLQEEFKEGIRDGLFFEQAENLAECSDSRIRNLRKILGTLFNRKLLWIPPSRPSRTLGGDFSGTQGLSKVLIFSSWRFVPRMISLILSAQYSRGKRFTLQEKPENPADQLPQLFWGQSPHHPAQALAAAVRHHFLFTEKEVKKIVDHYISEFGARIFLGKQNDKRFLHQKEFFITKEMMQYCYDGCLEDVFDEYLYMISCQLGKDAAAADLMRYLSHRNLKLPSGLNVEFVSGEKRAEKYFSDCFGEKDRQNRKNSGMEDGEEQNGSLENLQQAFNSPFAPFVLSTTSIGQEGLDFHWYCRKIIHWNIPRNPIELEQRNGRIDRFHSLSVRQSIVAGLNPAKSGSWTKIFESAKEKWHDTWGLVPDWYIENPEYPVEQYACYLPFSYDEEELKQLCFQSGCYRSVLGQPGFLEYSRSLDSPELLIKYALSFFPQKTM